MLSENQNKNQNLSKNISDHRHRVSVCADLFRVSAQLSFFVLGILELIAYSKFNNIPYCAQSFPKSIDKISVFFIITGIFYIVLFCLDALYHFLTGCADFGRRHHDPVEGSNNKYSGLKRYLKMLFVFQTVCLYIGLVMKINTDRGCRHLISKNTGGDLILAILNYYYIFGIVLGPIMAFVILHACAANCPPDPDYDFN